MTDLVNYLEGKKQDAITMLQRMVELESPSRDKVAVDKLVDHMEELSADFGASIQRIPQPERGDFLRLEWGQGEQQILVMAHLDTVWPVGEIAKRPVEIKDGKMYGPGVYDMKCGIVQTLFALKALRELNIKPKKRIVMLCNTDEEIGSMASRPYIKAEAKKSSCVLVPEPTGTGSEQGAVKIWRKGLSTYELKVTGVPAHAGTDHEKGASAIHELAHQIIKLEALTDYDKGTTINVGLVQGGYTKNVVPEFASAEIDVRVKLKEQAAKVENQILNLQPVLDKTTLKVTGGINRPPLEATERNRELYMHARKLAGELGFNLGESGAGGVSDGNITSDMGVATLDGIGAVGAGAHAIHEHVILDTIVPRTALMATLLATL